MRAFFYGIVLTTLSWPLVAAEPAVADTFPIGTVDLLRVFREHQPTRQKLEALRQEVQELDTKVAIRQVEIDTLQRRLQSPPQTGEDRDRLQVQLAKLQTELRLFVERERATVQKRELGLQVELYKQVREVVAKLAKQRGLKLVFVRPELSVDSQNPLEAGRAINGLLLYEEEGLEITDDVLTALAERATSTSASPSPATSEPVTSNPATAQPAKAK